MSGGAWEYVMGNYNDRMMKFAGFISMPEVEYYDLYISENVTIACDRGICYGHALSEMGGWYQDDHDVFMEKLPWIVRGGYYGSATSAGIFGFSRANGSADVSSASRAVYAP